MENLLGTTIGNYQVVEQLGRGGMANVYKAYHPGLAVYRALKVIRPELVGVQGFSDRFQLEARAVAGLRHPNIVQVHDFGQHQDLFYMVMEFVEGENLRDRIQREGPIRPFTEALRIIEQLAAGLGFAHDHDILHRDVKPENILLSTSGQAILADFGIAKMLASTDPKLTATGIGIGTPAYMAPELAMGSTDLTPAADLYAVGVVLYETLTAHSPFVADTPLAVLQRVIHDPVPPPRELTADIPDALQGVVLKSMAKDPALRYPNAAAFIEASRQSLLGMGPDQSPQGGTPRVPPPIPPPIPPAAPSTRLQEDHPTMPMPASAAPPLAATRPAAAPKPRSRAPFIAIAIAALLVLALGGAAVLAGWWWFNHRPTRDPEQLAHQEQPSAPLSLGAAAPATAQEDAPPTTEVITATTGGTAGPDAAGPDAAGPDAAGLTTSELDPVPDRPGAGELAEQPNAAQASSTPTGKDSTDAAQMSSTDSPDVRTQAAPPDALASAQAPNAGEPAPPADVPGTRFAGTLRFGNAIYGEAEPDEVVEYELELRRPTTVFFDVVSASRRGAYTFFDPDGEVLFRQQGNDFGPLRLETPGWYTLTVEAEGDLPLEFEVKFVRTGS